MISNKAILIRLTEAYAKLDRKKSKFDAEASAHARDVALDRVADAADPAWKRAALEAVVWVCERRATFTADAVWWALDFAGIGVPREPRALGAIFKIAEKVGLIVSTRQFEQTVRTSRHRTDVRVWRSMIYDRLLDTEDFPH